MVRAKTPSQELCHLKVDWDEEIPDTVSEQWRRWLADLPLLSEMTVPRSFKSSDTSGSPVTQLHHFSDASETAYGAVSYIRRDKKCCLVMLKVKLAPIKPPSIPCLELLATVVGTEPDQHIKRHPEIPIDETFFLE